MESVAIEPGLPVNADHAADRDVNTNNSVETLRERQHMDDNEEGSSDTLPWWKGLAHKALEYSEDELRPWSSVSQFQKCCAHRYHRKEIDEDTYIGSCCVELLYNILQFPSDERNLGRKINDLARCLSGRFEKVAHTEPNDIEFSLVDCILPTFPPNNLVLGDYVKDDISPAYLSKDLLVDSDMEVLAEIVELLQKLIRFQTSKSQKTNRVRLVYMQATEKWMVALAYLVAHMLYECCGIRSWKTIVEYTFKFTTCFKKVRFLKINAGLALCGLEILSTEGTRNQKQAVDGLTPTKVSDLLVSTSESVLTEVCRATGLPTHIVRACCCEKLLAEYKTTEKDFGEDNASALVQACRDLLKTQSPLVYIDELEKNTQRKQLSQGPNFPPKFLKASFPLDVHITILLMDGDINMTLEVVGKMEKSDLFDDESKDRAWNQVFVFLMQNNLLYLDECNSLDGIDNSSYNRKKDLLLFSVVDKLQLIGWEAMIAFHNFVLEKVWSNPRCTVDEKRYALLAAKKTILRCFMKKNLADGVHKFWNLSWSVDISSLYDGSNDNLLPPPPPPPAVPFSIAGNSGLPEGAVAMWAFDFLRTDNPVPQSLYDDMGDINLMRLVTEEQVSNEVIEQGEVEEVEADEKEGDESGVVAMDEAEDDGDIVECAQETEDAVSEADAMDDEVLEINSSSDDGGGIGIDGDDDGDGDYDEEDVYEDENDEYSGDAPIEVEDDDEDQDEMDDDVDDYEAYEVEENQEDDQDDADANRVDISDGAQDMGTHNDPVDLLDSSPEQPTWRTAQMKSNEEADSLSEGQDDGGERESVQHQQALDDEELADGDGSSVNGSISSGAGVQAEEKVETEAPPGDHAPGDHGVFGETTEEEDNREGQGRANRAAQAHREADVRAASLDYSSQLEEGYEPEDTHGYTEEEVSEAIHTEDEEEERRQSQTKSTAVQEVDSSSQQKSREEVEPEPASARNVPHSSDDMDAADEHTEQEEDLGAESSELEETADGLPPPAPASTQEFIDAPREEGNLRNLVDFAHSAMRRHDTLSNASRVPVASPAETNLSRTEDNVASASGQSDAVAALLAVARREPEVDKEETGELFVASTEPMDVDAADVPISNEAIGENDGDVQPEVDDQAVQPNQEENLEVIDMNENKAELDKPTAADRLHSDGEAEVSQEPTIPTEQEELPQDAVDDAVLAGENRVDTPDGNALEKSQDDAINVEAEGVESDAAPVDQVYEGNDVPEVDDADADEIEAATPAVKESPDNRVEVDVEVEVADDEQDVEEGEGEPENPQEVADTEDNQNDNAGSKDVTGTQDDEENDVNGQIESDASVEQEEKIVKGDGESDAEAKNNAADEESLESNEEQEDLNERVEEAVVEESNAGNATAEDEDKSEDAASETEDVDVRVALGDVRATDKTETVEDEENAEDADGETENSSARMTLQDAPATDKMEIVNDDTAPPPQESNEEAEDSDLEPEPETSPVKKKRGRPRKNPLPQESDGESQEAEPAPEPEPEAPPVKRRPGRPRKNPKPQESDGEADDPEPMPSPPKRRPGRPRKNPTPQEADEEADEPKQGPSLPKRRPGRPRKTDKPQGAGTADSGDSVASRRPKRGAKKSTPDTDNDASVSSNVSATRRSTRGRKKLDGDDESVASTVSSARRSTRGAKRKAANDIPASEDDTTSQASKRGKKKKTQDDIGSAASSASKTRSTAGRKKSRDEDDDNESTVSTPRKTRRSARSGAAQTLGDDDHDQSVSSAGSRSTRRSTRAAAMKGSAQQDDDDDTSIASRTRRSKRNQSDASEDDSVSSATASKGRPKRKRNQDSGSETTASKRRTTRSRGLSKIEEE